MLNDTLYFNHYIAKYSNGEWTFTECAYYKKKDKMSFKTKEYPENNEIVINEFKVNYSQINEEINDFDNNLELSIAHQGAGFYFVMKTERWAFESIDELVKILEDFKNKSNIE